MTHARRIIAAAALLSGSLLSSAAWANPSHCLTLYGDCKYKAGFDHFDYVNPNAPKGGAVKLAETGTFDSLQPYILKGVKAPAVEGLFESLMVQSQDEPMSMYGLVAETVDIAKDGSSATFVIRKEAHWHDGKPITADDVVFSFTALKEKGDPTFRIQYAPITGVEKLGEREVKFLFSDPKNHELPSIAAGMPILPKHDYDKRDFDKTTLTAPLGSGPYKLASVDAGRTVVYARVKDYWGANLPVNRGMNNFDQIRYDMYRDENVTLQALKAGEYDFRQEYIARNWATAYDFPAVKDGRIIKTNIPHQIPQGMQAFMYNLRKPYLADRRVREAIAQTLDFAWLNKTIFYGAYQRNDSFFKNTDFAATGVPQGDELKLLEPFRDQLPPELFTQPFKVPETDGSGNNRANLVYAQKLLEEAGWVIQDGKRVNKETGEPMKIEFMLRQPTVERVIGPMRKGLDRLGIASTIRNVDDAQYQKRVDSRDFDIISIWVNRGVFYPGNEQTTLWHSSQAEVKGSNNNAGLQNPAVDAMLDRLVKADDLRELTAAGRALDRILLWEHVVIPHWSSYSFRLAFWDKFGRPEISPKYGIGFQTWWIKNEKSRPKSN